MKQAIKADGASGGSLISMLSKSLQTALKGLLDLGVQYDRATQDKDGNKILTMILTVDGKEERCKVKFIPHIVDGKASGMVDIHIKSSDGKVDKAENVKDDKSAIMSTLTKLVEKMYDVDTIDDLIDTESGKSALTDAQVEDASNGSEDDFDDSDVASSTKVVAKFEQIKSGTDVTIGLTRVMCNGNIITAKSALNKVLAADEFLSTVGEDGVVVEIIDTPSSEDLDVEPCTEDNICQDENSAESFIKLMCTIYKAELDALAVHWNSRGKDFYTLHDVSQDMYNMCAEQLDTLAELMVEFNGFAPHLNDICSDISSLDVTSGFDLCTGVSILKQDIQEIVSALEVYYCNFKSDVQSEFDNWMREWNKLADFKFAQLLQK